MQRFDRTLGILLFLRSKPSVSAAALARQFDVSTRTIYHDLETLSALGVPLYAERGRQGGVRLLPGYFLPPLMFTRSEAIALLLGLTLQKSLQYASPYRTNESSVLAEPLGLLWDRDRWYLAGRSAEREERPVGLWRADRVVQIKPCQPLVPLQPTFVSFDS